MPAPQPNILFICTDQESALALGCAGNAWLKTPAMDRLAAEGIRFDNAYCTQPLCSPSRASLFTGLMPQEAGVTRNGGALSDSLRGRTLGECLRQGGYDCFYGGKWHVPNMSLGDGEHGFTVLAGFGDHRLTDACETFLGQPHRKPFFLAVNFDNPHNICEWARNEPLPWGPIPPPDPASLPPLPANFEPPDNEPDCIRTEQKANQRLYPAADFSDHEWRLYRHAYYRLVEKVDAQIGRVLAALDRAGLAENTLVVLTSDHGDGHGAHRWNQKSVLYEEVVRIPLILRLPGRIPAGRVDRRLVSNGLDLLPTLCDFAGAPAPDGLRGVSLRAVAEGANPARWREDLAIRTFFDGDRGYQTTGWALRCGRWKYTAYSWLRNREQLFDLESDPGETRSLVNEPGQAAVLADLRARLHGWCRSTQDPFRVPGHLYAIPHP